MNSRSSSDAIPSFSQYRVRSSSGCGKHETFWRLPPISISWISRPLVA